MKTAFNFIANRDSQVLILGSMPGEKSLQENHYYAHPRNSFWWIISNLIGEEIHELDFDARYTSLLKHKFALWDVVQACEREGSLDSAIQKDNMQLNDFSSFLRMHNQIHTIACNGGFAHRTFKQKVLPTLPRPVELIALPSTSPAYASMTKEEKLEQWKVLLNQLS